ncbi:PTS system, mannose-specific IIA component [Enterococcus sp. 7F3_DIV0205]|uniref:PTS system, mannose-specific IIA component n=1 Tax=Candidatus Enterococcus palustris TaxID=1834189 RepID=A0AAQ3W8D4_9ENTE|nr:PTS fructose transporter subunit IIA [Enterococcus sp. 7F3_DIV0205]OTN86062.1 hypothetical protein A5821_002012 [Enterococcus sp. 7F3_DIV0205]
MKPKLILMSHGNMAAETLHSAKMIVGELIDAEVVSMTEADGMYGTTKKLVQILDSLGNRQVLILADLKGGTPCNVGMMQMSEHPNLRVLSGLNLAMVIEAAVSQIEQIDELTDYLCGIGKNAIEKIELPELDDEDGYEE